jgi:lysophospholipase L1-like esterase
MLENMRSSSEVLIRKWIGGGGSMLPLFVVVILQSVTMNEAYSQKKMRYLALGDSYTIGESVAEEERWPVQLATILPNVNTPTIIATTGWRTDDLMNAIQKSALQPPYDLVSLLIGVNNQYQGRSVDAYKPEFEELLKKAIELAGNDRSKVIVVSIPDYGYTPFGKPKQSGITKDIDAFNDANKSITAKLGVRYVNITDISRRGFEDPALVASDGLHPSGKQYTLWVERIRAALPK